MFSQKRIYDFRWKVFLYVLSLFTDVLCYDSCPENYRHSAAANAPNLPEYAIEGAFSYANWTVQNQNQKSGRVYPKGLKIPETVHPQASHKKEIPHMEARQRIFDEASKNLATNYELSPTRVTCGLPKLQLTGEYAIRALEECHTEEEIVCNTTDKYRTADGSCNNLDHPTWGRAFSPVNRFFLPSPTGPDGLRKSVLCDHPLPNPRMLSSHGYYVHNKRTTKVNNLHVSFGQFLTHDITFTAQTTTEKNEAIQCCPLGQSSHPQCAPIDTTGYPSYNGNSDSTCINFVRSAIYPSCSLGHRTQINTATSFIDGSQIYGTSLHEMNSLRALDGTGKLLVQHHRFGPLLPNSTDPSNDRCSVPRENMICFRAGDQRVNQNPMLTSMHTIWVRQHNRIATELKKLNPHWGEERCFQEARRIVIAELQTIVITEYLPATLGDKYMNIFGNKAYNILINPNIYTEFSTAAFRFGHSMIESTIAEMPRRPGHSGHLLRDKFSEPFGLYEGEVNLLMMGSSRTAAQPVDRSLVIDVTDYLYRTRGQKMGLDLGALNIQRGRDHALPSYVDVHNACNPEKPIETFFDLLDHQVMTREDMDFLRYTYRDVNNIDLWYGIISEIPVHDGVLGPTGSCVIAAQFHALMSGDRYWYTHNDEAGSFTKAQLNHFEWSTSLASIICANTNITEMPRNSMLLPNNGNPLQHCRSFSRLYLNAWREN